ncbi:response regulator [Arcticibacterium luteifluviistationis]|uniref:Response regulator n=1 Tax=Arcticibacterium luteifluviistationis TaxID=1784714 RepID=A0A2Z4G8J5_9BACT|nr:response regulator [Arcticibacterium luteifluviistationis]AWV97517.1 response regulator [Arcticibacterium luteifluviistationis]
MKNIFLADDDADDQEFFIDALEEVTIPTELTISNNGLELMSNLDVLIKHPPPHVIFLDLNMPLKDGFQCLDEIRSTPKLQGIPVVIFSTSDNHISVDKTYEGGANYYIRKPTSFPLLVKAIEKVLTLEMYQVPQPAKENYYLSIV